MQDEDHDGGGKKEILIGYKCVESKGDCPDWRPHSLRADCSLSGLQVCIQEGSSVQCSFKAYNRSLLNDNINWSMRNSTVTLQVLRQWQLSNVCSPPCLWIPSGV